MSFFSPLQICYVLETPFLPDVWNCLSCERELRAAADRMATSEESADALAEYLAGDAYCGDVAANVSACAEQGRSQCLKNIDRKL